MILNISYFIYFFCILALWKIFLQKRYLLMPTGTTHIVWFNR
jgi:hypothetical protein